LGKAKNKRFRRHYKRFFKNFASVRIDRPSVALQQQSRKAFDPRRTPVSAKARAPYPNSPEMTLNALPLPKKASNP
jgi:hypothetical protein